MTDVNPETEADLEANPELHPYESFKVPALSSPLAFDIETIPNPDAMDLLPEPKPKANLKDKVKIIADIEEKRRVQISKMGLNGNTGLVCAVGFAGIKADDGEYWFDALMYDEATGERVYLGAIFDAVEGPEENSHSRRYITFNGIGFDIPFLLRRALAHKVYPPTIDTAKYKVPPNGNHYDLQQIISGFGAMETGGFDFICKTMLGAGKTEGIDGSKVGEAWLDGQQDKIKEYAANDALLTLKLWERCKGIYFE